MAAEAAGAPDPRRWWTLIVLCTSLMVIGVDNTILNVALPTLSRTLGASTSRLQWIVDAYTLVFAGLLLTAGSLGDRFGRRRALTFGLLVFGTGSVASALVGSSGQLIATRAFMGIGGACIMPSTLSIITNVFTVPGERAKAIAIWAGVSGVGIGLGPVAGGWLLQHFYWGSVFLVNVPIVVGSLVAGRFLIPESKDPTGPRLDPVGAVLSIAGLSALLYAIIEGPAQGWSHGSILLGFGIAAVVLPSFIAWEARIDHPMLDVAFFKNPRFTAASSAITLVFFALFGSLFFLTQLLQSVLGLSALQAGVRVLPQAACLMVFAPVSARMVQVIGTKIVVTFGLVTVAAGFLVGSRFGYSSGYGVLLISIVLQGVGMGCVMAPATESIMGSLPRRKAGVGSAVNDTTRQVGGTLGVAILGSILSSIYTSHLRAHLGALHLTPQAAAAATSSIGGALQGARRLGGSAGATLTRAARHAFIDASSRGFLAAALVALIGAGVAVVFLPARAPEEADSDAAATGEAASDAAAPGEAASGAVATDTGALGGPDTRPGAPAPRPNAGAPALAD